MRLQVKKKEKLEHNSVLCKHKTFLGMRDGHCVKCGLAYKNCDKCFTPKKSKKVKKGKK